MGVGRTRVRPRGESGCPVLLHFSGRRPFMSGTSGPDPIVAELVETMRKLAGSHPGYRPVHAKGLGCAGTFRATAEAKRISRAAHLQGQGVAAIVRFANSSGNPDVHDGQPSVRSLAVKLKLADGKIADILANSV